MPKIHNLCLCEKFNRMKILLIQQKMIGDVLVSSLLAELIKQQYPTATIHYLIHSSTQAVVLNNPYIDKILLFDANLGKQLRYNFKYISELRKQKYDVVIDVYAKIGTALMSMLSNAPLRISYYKKYTSFCYTHAIKKSKKNKSNVGLTIEERMSLLLPMGIKPNYTVTPKLFLTDAEKQEAQLLLKQHGVSLNKKTFMVSIIGSAQHKTYPDSYMAQIIDNIAAEGDCNILLNYIPSQKKQAQQIFDLCSESTKSCVFFELLGKNLREFILIMNCCDAIIGNDGGATNMAKSLNKPSFIIFAPWINKLSWNTYEDNYLQQTVHLKDFKPELFLSQTSKELRAATEHLYAAFKPELFEEQLSLFIQTIHSGFIKNYQLKDSVMVF